MSNLTWVLKDELPPEQKYEVSCDAKRGPRSQTHCEMPALHNQGCLDRYGYSHHHCGRSPAGRWFSWT